MRTVIWAALAVIFVQLSGCDSTVYDLQAYNHTNSVARLTVISTSTPGADPGPPRRQTFIVEPKSIFDFGSYDYSQADVSYEVRFDDQPEKTLKWTPPDQAGAKFEGVHLYRDRIGPGGALPWNIEVAAGPVLGWILFILLMALPFAIPSVIIYLAVRRVVRANKEAVEGQLE